MVTTIPHTEVELAPPSPLPYGLYSAAVLQDVPQLRGGVTLRPGGRMVVGGGSWAEGCEPASENPEKAGQSVGNPPAGDAFGVWVAHDCKMVGVSEEEALQLAAGHLPLVESMEVEKHLAARLAAAESTVVGGDAASSADAAEKALASINTSGLIHAPRWRIREFEKAGAIIRQGQALFSPGGHRWVFGSGYDALGQNIVVTGRVAILRDAITTAVAAGLQTNQRLAVAERRVAVAVEPPMILIQGE